MARLRSDAMTQGELRSDAAAILVIGNIPDVMHFIINAPCVHD